MIVACILTAFLPIAALAATYHYTARTAAPVAKQGVVMAGGVRWKCAGRRCTTAGPWPRPAVRACHALARRVGAIAFYGHPKKRLTARQLAKCNKGVAKRKAHKPGQSQSATALRAPVRKPHLQQNLQAPHSRIRPGIQPPHRPSKSAALSRPSPQSPLPKGARGGLPSSRQAMPARSPLASGTSGPHSLRTLAFTVTGTGALATRGPFSPRTFTTDELSVTGVGELTERAPFTSKSFNAAAGFTLTGTGTLH